MKTISLMIGFILFQAATTALAAPALKLDDLKGYITRGQIKEAKIDSDPPAGAKYKKGDELEGGSILSGTIKSGELTSIPDNYSVASGVIISASKADLSKLALEKVTVIGAMVKGSSVTISEKITVNLASAHIEKADFSQKSDSSSEPTKEKPTPSLSAPAKDISFEGDYIYIKNEVHNFVDVYDKTNTPITAKPGTKFKVDREQKLENGQHKLIVTRSNCGGPGESLADVFMNVGCKESTSEDLIQTEKMYSINKEEIMYGNYLHHGFGWGVMVTPFKFYPKDKTLAPGNSIGPYLSYIYDKPGFSFGPAASLSYTSLPVTTIQNGISTTTNQSGLTAALGMLFRIKNQFTMGVMVGRDYIDSQYKYNGATWLGANFGYELGN